jgi:hypothetical protein
MSEGRPYLSVVASTRNDNHGGDLTRRTQIFIDALVAQAARHRVETELILVEWNPPPDRPPLAAELHWPEDNPWCGIRIITVGPEIHRRFGYSDRLPIFQMMAKNAGVRRAAGRFVLHTNIDIVFSDAIFAWIAGRSLRPGVVYRCDRVDVDREVPVGVPLTEQLEYCANHVLRIGRKDGMWVVPEPAGSGTIADARFQGWGSAPAASPPPGGPSPSAASRMSRAVTRLHRTAIRLQERADRLVVAKRIRRAKLLELTRVGLYASAAMVWPLYLVAARVRRSRLVVLAEIEVPAARRKLRALGYRPTLAELMDELRSTRLRIPDLHTVACGDFMLTDMDSWHRMRGTPELSIYSMYLDALAMVTAYRTGLVLQDLPPDHVIYHIDHGSGWTPAQHDALYRRMNEIGIPILSHATYVRYAADLLLDESYFLASLEWGLAGDALPERTVTRRRAAAAELRLTGETVHHEW